LASGSNRLMVFLSDRMRANNRRNSGRRAVASSRVNICIGRITFGDEGIVPSILQNKNA
jgi:hypothetical protein